MRTSFLNKGKASSVLMLFILFGIAVVVLFVFLMIPPPNSTDRDETEALKGEGKSPKTLAPGLDPTSIKDSADTKEKLPPRDGNNRIADQEKRETLKGRVAHVNRDPAEGARVKAVRIKSLTGPLNPNAYDTFETQCAADGGFSFDNIPAGQYSLKAELHNYTGHLNVFAGGVNHPDGRITLHEIVIKSCGSISGRVMGPDQGPVHGAVLIPVQQEASSTQTDSKGVFLLNGLDRNSCSLIVFAEGLGWRRVNNVIIGTQDLKIQLFPGGRISGRVTLDGAPMPGVLICSNRKGYSTPISRTAVSDKNGEYVLGPLGSGSFRPQVLTQGFSSLACPVIRLKDGQHEIGVDLPLQRNRVLSGRVLDGETGKPVSGLWVRALPKSALYYYPGYNEDHVKTNRNGEFTFPDLPPHDYMIGVKGGQGYEPTLWNKGETVSFNKQMDRIEVLINRGHDLQVNVCDASGKGFSGVHISLREARTEIPQPNDLWRLGLLPTPLEISPGCYHVQGLPKGVYQVSAGKKGWKYRKEIAAVENRWTETTIILETRESYSARGVVKDKQGTLIPGALVKISGKSAFSGQDGGFEIHDLSPGTEHLNVTAMGFVEMRMPVKIHKGMKLIEAPLLRRGNGFIAGRVVNDLGESLSNVEVKIRQQAGNSLLSKSMFTASDGGFRFDGLLDMEAEISAKTEFCQPQDHPIRIQPNQSALELGLKRYARIKGRVRNKDHSPTLAFFAYAKKEKIQEEVILGARKLGQAFTQGAFDLPRAPTGKVRVFVFTRDGRRANSEVLDLSPGQTMDTVTITLHEMGILKGRVLDAATLQPVANASIYLRNEADVTDFTVHKMAFEPNAKTRADGAFSIENLIPGTGNLWVSCPGYMDQLIKNIAVIPGNQWKPLEVLLEQGCHVSGRVYVDGQPRTGAQVWALGQEEKGGQTVSGAGGAYGISGLPAGDYTLRAVIKENDYNQNFIEKRITLKAREAFTCDLALFGKGALEGKVYLSGKVQRGVYVRAVPNENNKSQTGGTARSGPDGAYRINRLSPGAYAIRASGFNGMKWRPSSQDVMVGEGVTAFDVHLGQEGTAEINGYVHINNQLAPGAKVSVSGEGVYREAVTDKKGNYQFALLPEGKITVQAVIQQADSSCVFRVKKSMDLKEGETVRQDLNGFFGSGSIAGKVVCNKAPVLKALLEIQNKDLNIRVQVMDGAYRVEGLAPGEYHIRLLAPDWLLQVVRVKPHAETRTNFVYASSNARIQGVVKTPVSKGGRQAFVFLFEPGVCPLIQGEAFSFPSHENGLIATASQIDESGMFGFQDLPEKTLEIVAVWVDSGKILKLDKKKLILNQDEVIKVELSVCD